MKVLLAIDEEPNSDAALHEVATRPWGKGAAIRVFHAAGKFVPPTQEFWHDAGGDLDVARQQMKDRFENESGSKSAA